MSATFYERLEAAGIIPVIVLEDESQAAMLARALMAGGMRAAEITFRTPAAAESIRIMRDAHPEMLIGAGTVLTCEQADEAVSAGASFIVAPNLDVQVVRHCIDLGVPVVPGTVTPTEIGAARKLGCSVTKFFPATSYGGLAAIKAICAPFVDHRFMPTGGVSLENVEEYLAAPEVIACGGTWMVKPRLFADGDFSEVEHLAAEAMEAVRRARG